MPRTPTAAPLAVPRALSPSKGREESRSRYRSLADPESLREFAKNLREGIYITTPENALKWKKDHALTTVDPPKPVEPVKEKVPEKKK